MGRLSQAAKGGLAAGLIFGFLIGLLHLGTLVACSSAQQNYIAGQLLAKGSNVSVSTVYSFDLVYYPMVNGLLAFVIAVILAVGFGALYLSLPGRDSKRKGELWAVPVLVVELILGPAYIPYTCSPSFLPYLATAAALPAAIAFGFLLGVFYDAFGRLAIEQQEELAKRKEAENASGKGSDSGTGSEPARDSFN